MSERTFWSYWDDLLDGVQPPPPFYDGKPQGGVYWMKNGSETRASVRIDREGDDGTILCWVDGKAIAERDEINRVWKRCGRNALLPDVYDQYRETGKWPDEAFAKAKPAAPASMPDMMGDMGAVGPSDLADDLPSAAFHTTYGGSTYLTSQPAPLEGVSLGGNNPPPNDVHELLPYLAAQLKDWFAKISNFTDKKQVEEAANQCDGLRKLVSQAKKLHKTEKEPHLEAGRAVDRKYLDNIDVADKLLKSIGAAVAKFADAEMAKQREAADAKRAMDEAKATDVLNEAVGKTPEEQIAAMKAAAELVVTPAAPAPAPVKITNSMGKGGFTVKMKRLAEVTNQDALYYAVKDDPGVAACLRAIAQRELDGGRELPGVKVVETTVAGTR